MLTMTRKNSVAIHSTYYPFHYSSFYHHPIALALKLYVQNGECTIDKKKNPNHDLLDEFHDGYYNRAL